MWDSSRVTYTATTHAANTLSVNNDDLLRRTDEIPHEFAERWGDETKARQPPESAKVGSSNDAEEDVEDWRQEWLLERLEIEDIARGKRCEAGDVSADGLTESCETTEVVTMDRDNAQCAYVSSGSGAWHSSTIAGASTPHIFDGTDVTTEEGQTQVAKVLAGGSKWWHDKALLALPESSSRPPQPEQAKITASGGKPTAFEPIVITRIAEEASDDTPLVPREPPVANVKEGNGGTQEGRTVSRSGHNDKLAEEELTGEAEECSEGSKVADVTEGEPTPSPFGAPIAIEDLEDLRVLLQQHDLALDRDRRRSYRPRR